MLDSSMWQGKLQEGSLLDEYFSLCAAEHMGKGHKHHILPKSIWPEFTKCSWNIVKLSYRQHYRAHEILAQVCLVAKDKERMLHAWHFMATDKKNKDFIDADMFDKLCVARSKALSESQIGMRFSDERKANISKSLKGRKVSDEFREVLRKAMTVERKAEISRQHKGKIISEEARRKQSLSRTGKKMSEEAKKNMRDSFTPERRAQISKSNMGKEYSKATREKMSLTWKGRKRTAHNVALITEHKSKYSYIRYDLDGTQLEVYLRKADLIAAGFCYSSVRECCTGKYETGQGFKWKRVAKL